MLTDEDISHSTAKTHRITQAQLLEQHDQVASCLIAKTFAPELLGEIFLFYCASTSIIIPYRQRDLPSPVTLSHVCSRWRSIALNTAELWSNISFDVERARRSDPVLEATKLVLSRSGTFPLSLALLPYNPHKSSDQMGRNVLVSSLTRCRSLSLPHQILQLSSFSFLPRDSTSSLDTLRIHFDRPWTPAKPVSLFASSTQIRRLILESFLELVDPSMLRLPLSQLTAVQLKNIRLPSGGLHTLLSECRSLVDCILHVTEVAPALVSRAEIRIPTLRALSLSMIHPSLLSCLVFDGLVSLELVASRICWCLPVYTSLHESSTFSLQRLAIRDLNTAEEELDLLLQVVPSIVELDLDTHILDALITDKISRGELLPQLEFLRLSVTTPRIASIVSIIHKRAIKRTGPTAGYTEKLSTSLLKIVSVNSRHFTKEERQLLKSLDTMCSVDFHEPKFSIMTGYETCFAVRVLLGALSPLHSYKTG